MKSVDALLMGRYRAPAAKKSPYITREGYLRLQQEEKAIWKRRREVTAALTAAAAEGDRSENAEYIYRKKELREIDRRIRYLQKRMPDLKVIDLVPDDPEAIFFSAWVTLEDSDGNESNYRIVGPDEFDVEPGYISMDSPMAKALFKHSIDDEVTVQTPAGNQLYLVTDVRYDSTSN
ncbi:transcription elongation factor GreB [Solemya velum gill symbiont]|uniref:Transcription elongation factor GreB n=2 Tax=Solemya velum gill symbiont TaxID=2340 RepID=A0A0B0H923_SOVGS|nr:transcription elongation factor GreB [Solemya velum gill symbiont]